MVKKIQFDVDDEELAKLLIQKGNTGWREMFLSKMGIESETRKMGRKPLTKGEQDLALKRLKAMYYNVIDGLDDDTAPVLKEIIEAVQKNDVPAAVKANIVAGLKKIHIGTFKTMRASVAKMALKDVEEFGEQAVKVMLTPPKMPTIEEMYAATAAGRKPLEDYEKAMRKWKVDAFVIKTGYKPSVREHPVFDTELRYKALQMAAKSPHSVEYFLEKLRAEEK